MTVNELMAELVSMYPNQLGNKHTMSAWKRQFESALGRFEGEALTRGWKCLNESWDKAQFPRPADLLKACNGRVTADESSAVSGSARERWEYVDARLAPTVAKAMAKAESRWKELWPAERFPEFWIRLEAETRARRRLQVEYLITLGKAKQPDLARKEYPVTFSDDELLRERDGVVFRAEGPKGSLRLNVPKPKRRAEIPDSEASRRAASPPMEAIADAR